LNEESFEQGLLEYPQYTRPREWQGRGVPEVLLSGDHGRIARWRREQAEQLTRERRPDLWARYQGEGGSGGAGSLRDTGARPYVTASGKDDGR
jgi:tRNA (guanine37-N1)-methyltransferase